MAYDRTRYRTIDMNLGGMESVVPFYTIIDDVGSSEDFVISLDPTGDAFGLGTTDAAAANEGTLVGSVYGHLTKWDMRHLNLGGSTVAATFEEAR